MSDYEGEDGWTPVQFSSSNGHTTYSEHVFQEQIAPSNYRSPDPSELHATSGRRGKRVIRPNHPTTFHPLVQNITSRVQYGAGGKPIEHEFYPLPKNIDSEALRLYTSRPDEPDDVYYLNHIWKEFLRFIPESTSYKSSDVARNRLDIIGLQSETFIKTPDSDSPIVQIWGSKEQCENAKAGLKSWETHLRNTSTRNWERTWSKNRAFDGRKEDRSRQDTWQELEEQALQQSEDNYFEFEAYLVWPQDYDLDAYIQKHETSALREIAKDFRCRFRHERKARPRHTKVQAESESNLLSAYQRLINLAKEMVSLQYRGTRGNFVQLPDPHVYRNQIDVEEIADSKPSEYRVVLCGDKMSEHNVNDWLDGVKAHEKQTRIELRNSIDTFLKTLHVSQCQVSLKVSFGEILLQRFQKGKGGLLSYNFGEFLRMIQDQRTLLTDPIVRSKDGDLTSLADKFTAMDALEHPGESYRQVFEFQGSDSTNILRLDIEMQPGYDLDEPQVCSQRWLTHKTYIQNENILDLKVFSFDRPGYVIRSELYDLFASGEIPWDMEAFRNAVSFKPSRDGIKAFPKLRSTFPSHSKLITVSEFTSINYRLRNTDGIVELRREDIYLQDTSTPSKLPNNSRFEVLFHYPGWDNLLGEFSNIKAGGPVSWQRDISTFFPDHVDPDRPQALPKGFKTFLKEVRKVQDLLHDVLSELDPSQTEN